GQLRRADRQSDDQEGGSGQQLLSRSVPAPERAAEHGGREEALSEGARGRLGALVLNQVFARTRARARARRFLMPTIAPVWPLSSHFGHVHGHGHVYGGGARDFRDGPSCLMPENPARWAALHSALSS